MKLFRNEEKNKNQIIVILSDIIYSPFENDGTKRSETKKKKNLIVIVIVIRSCVLMTQTDSNVDFNYINDKFTFVTKRKNAMKWLFRDRMKKKEEEYKQ